LLRSDLFLCIHYQCESGKKADIDTKMKQKQPYIFFYQFHPNESELTIKALKYAYVKSYIFLSKMSK